MDTPVSLFAFAFKQPNDMPKMVPKITRADMGLILPRLDVNVLDESGNTDPKKKADLEATIEKYKAVYALGGRITQTKLTKGRGDDPSVRFVGQFKALVNPGLANKNVGNYFVSGRCHVPRFFEEQLYALVLDAKEKDENATLEFLIGVGLKPPHPTKPSTVGYDWTVEPLVDMAAADNPVDQLFARGAARLTGPASAPQTEAQTEPATRAQRRAG